MSEAVMTVQSWEDIDAGIPVEFNGDLDSSTCLVSFQQHWNQASEIIKKSWKLPGGVSSDDVSCVINNLEQMASLILVDAQLHRDSPGPIMDLLLKDNILGSLLEWSLQCEEYAVPLKLEQLKIYELLFSHSHLKLWGHRVLLKPLLDLISSCREPGNVEVEKRLVVLLNQLCVSLMQDMELLNMFFSVSPEQDPSRFILFSLLIPFVHREGSIGQQARDALLLCMALSRKSETIASYIGKHSSLCPVLATGLSGLYSALPQRIKLPPEDGSMSSWHCLTPEDGERVAELQLFLDSLEFTNAIFQIAHPLVQTELLEYIFHGFLVPVMGPALHQLYPEELAAATAYLDLFLRTVSEPSLVYVFLKFIFTCKYEGSRIIDTVVSRLSTCRDNRTMTLVTLSLLRTLVDLNCEDVMLDLVFRHLLPGTHVMVSQRRELKGLDARAASKLLGLAPRCFRTAAGWEEEGDSQAGGEGGEKFWVYLKEARRGVKGALLACRSWRFGYEESISSNSDGSATLVSESTLLNPVTKSSPVITRTGRTGSDGDVWRKRVCDATWTQKKKKNVSETGMGSKEGVVNGEDGEEPEVEKVASKVEGSLDVEVDVRRIFREIESWEDELKGKEEGSEKERNGDEDSGVDVRSFFDTYWLSFDDLQSPDPSCPSPTLLPPAPFSCPPRSLPATPVPPDIGPFLNAVFDRLESMPDNDFQVNLQLTGLVSKLAAFPQPVLRSFLLSDSLVVQPSVRSLPQVLASLRQKFDQSTAGISSVGDVIREAKRFLRDVAPRKEVIFRGADESANTGLLLKPKSSHESLAHKVESKYQSLASRLFRRAKKPSSSFHHPADGGFLEELPGEGYRYTRFNSSLPPQPHFFHHHPTNGAAATPQLPYPQTRVSRSATFSGGAYSASTIEPAAEAGASSRKAPRRVVLAAVLFEEWLHELAALALEHSLAGEEFSFFFPGSPSRRLSS